MTDVPMESATHMAPFQPQERFRRLGDIVIDRETRSVLREGQVTRLEPRVFTLLLYFMDNPGREISRQELGERVWNGVHVVDEAIQRAISVLRQALGDTPKQGLHIQTTGSGAYRLVSDPSGLPVQSLASMPDWRALAVAALAGALLAVIVTTALADRDATAPPAPTPQAYLPTEGATPQPAPPEAIAPRAP